MSANDVTDVRLRRQIIILMGGLNTDELEVLLTSAQGLVKGREVYGPLDVERPDRDWVEEAYEEIRDLDIYLQAAKIRLNRLRGKR